METILQIKVDDVVLSNAESVARNANRTVIELLNDYILQLSKQVSSSERPVSINTKEELYEALEFSRKQYENGEVITEEEYFNLLDELRGE